MESPNFSIPGRSDTRVRVTLTRLDIIVAAFLILRMPNSFLQVYKVLPVVVEGLFGWYLFCRDRLLELEFAVMSRTGLFILNLCRYIHLQWPSFGIHFLNYRSHGIYHRRTEMCKNPILEASNFREMWQEHFRKPFLDLAEVFRGIQNGFQRIYNRH